MDRGAAKAKSITTIIMVGWKVSGSLAYTSVGATLHDYPVVIPVDRTAATTDYEQTIGLLSNIEPRQRQPEERASKSPDAEPQGNDHLPRTTIEHVDPAAGAGRRLDLLLIFS
jgi:hypothetical protein